MVSDLHRFNADPDLDQAFLVNADPDPASHNGEFNLRLLAYRPFQGCILILHTSILSVYGPPRLHFKSLKLLNFDFDADPDPAFHSSADPQP